MMPVELHGTCVRISSGVPLHLSPGPRELRLPPSDVGSFTSLGMEHVFLPAHKNSREFSLCGIRENADCHLSLCFSSFNHTFGTPEFSLPELEEFCELLCFPSWNLAPCQSQVPLARNEKELLSSG